MGGGAFGLVGLEVAMLAGRLLLPLVLAESDGFLYPWMSSMLVTLGTVESGELTASFLPLQGSLLYLEGFCFSSDGSDDDDDDDVDGLSFSVR